MILWQQQDCPDLKHSSGGNGIEGHFCGLFCGCCQSLASLSAFCITWKIHSTDESRESRVREETKQLFTQIAFCKHIMSFILPARGNTGDSLTHLPRCFIKCCLVSKGIHNIPCIQTLMRRVGDGSFDS